MAERLLTQSAFEVSPQLIAHPLASPLRRLGAFLFDWILLSIPTLLVSCVVAAGSLLLTDPDGLRGIRTLMTGELLVPYDFNFYFGTNPPPPAPDQIRFEIRRLIPNTIRGIAVFGTAALYFTFFTVGSRSGTFGKRLFGIRVVRIDDKPLSYYESFERFGGYLASAGTFGVGFIDLWRDPNRRLIHDRISNTIVMRKTT